MRKRAEIILIAIGITAIIAGIYIYVTFYTPASREGGVKVIEVPKGASFRVVAMSLEKAGIIRSSGSLVLAANILGANKKAKAGEYEFSPAMTPMEVLELLIKGRVKRHLVTMPEGFSVREVASVLGEKGLVDEKEFLSRAFDARFAASLGLEGQTLEGYLFPDTY